MPNDATKAFVAGTGRVMHAPLGTALPTTAIAVPNVLFKELGFIDENGVVPEIAISTDKKKAWQGSAIVRVVRTEHSASWTFTVLEDNDEVAKMLYGSAATAASFSVDGLAQAHEAFIIDAIDGTNVKRIVIPNGEVIDIKPAPLTASGIAGTEVTITSYPDATGKKYYQYTATP